MLANILRTDRQMHRPLPANSEQALAVKALARQHQEAIWAMHQTISRFRSVLLEFYPQAVQAFPKLKHHAATTVLAAAPTPAAGLKLTRRRVEALLHKCGRRNEASSPSVDLVADIALERQCARGREIVAVPAVSSAAWSRWPRRVVWMAAASWALAAAIHCCQPSRRER